jgi:hypothetical protein
MRMWLKVTLTLGGIAAGLAGFIVLMMVAGVGAPSNYSVNLPPKTKDVRYFDFKGGVQYRITVTSDQNSDVDIYLFAPGSDTLVAKDDSVGPNSLVHFKPATDGRYKVVVVNLGPGANRSHVKFETVTPDQPPAPQVPRGQAPDKPEGPLTKAVHFPSVPIVDVHGDIVKHSPFDRVLEGRRCQVFSADLKAEKTYTVTLESKHFAPVLRLEDQNGKELARQENGDNQKVRLTFRPPQPGTYRVIVTSLKGHGEGDFTLAIAD